MNAGYDVRLITLPDNDVLTYAPPNNVYGILAAPPCTMFSLARTTAKTPRNLRLGMETVEACLRIVWASRFAGKLRFWALENPLGLLRDFLGKPAITFQPCDFGDAYTKKTDLWGRFIEPKKSPVLLTAEMKLMCAKNTRPLPSIPGGLAARRAVTPPLFAEAFFRANR